MDIVTLTQRWARSRPIILDSRKLTEQSYLAYVVCKRTSISRNRRKIGGTYTLYMYIWYIYMYLRTCTCKTSVIDATKFIAKIEQVFKIVVLICY